MGKRNVVSVKHFCANCNIPTSFITSLKEFELIETVKEDNEEYIKITHLKTVEKMIRLHYELNINMEGLDAVNNLLDQVTTLKEEIHALRNRLNLYE